MGIIESVSMAVLLMIIWSAVTLFAFVIAMLVSGYLERKRGTREVRDHTIGEQTWGLDEIYEGLQRRGKL